MSRIVDDGAMPRVFVSYAHDSAEHRDLVLRFASFLREHGIDAVLDTWFTGARQDWYAWAIREMTEADFVVVVASPRYRQVGDGSGPADLHKGVQSEAALLRDLIYGDRGRWLPKVLPVILDGHGLDGIPLFLQPNTASHFKVDSLTVAGADDLLRVILRQPAHVPPPVAVYHGSRAEWGGFDRLPAQVQSLLRVQEITAADLPYRLRGARQQSLGAIYVRQELGTGTDAPRPEQPRTEPYRDGKVPVSLPEPPTVRLVVRPPARPIHAALDADDHLLVTGGPGQGKSTLSLRLTADIVVAWWTGETPPLAEPVVPLRLTARVLAARRDLPFAQLLAECVRVEYGALLSGEVDARLLAERVAGCRWLLLVDGLDEVADAGERDRLVRVLASWASHQSPYRMLLTTRPIEGAVLAPFQRAGAARYELQPFDEAALRDFARNWFAEEGPDAADRFVRQVRRAHLDELVRVPLLATIAAIIFTEHSDVPLPDNQYELYEAYLDFLRSGRPAGEGRFQELRTPLLEHLGRVRLETDAPLLAAALDWYADRVPLSQRPAGWRDDLLTFLTAIGPLAMPGDELRFLHHSFAEHLAATSMARDLPVELAEDHQAFTHLLYAARDEISGRYPRTVLLHYTRLHPDQADRLLRLLHAGIPADHLLAARLLAKHVPADASVVEEFLTTARAWAMVKRYPGKSILEEITRATHHPGLVPWLVGLSRDETAPWSSRVIAATALASHPDEPHAASAADLLEAVVQNAGLPITDRLDAAEGLVDCGVGRRDAAERALRLVLADPATSAYRRRAATVVLASLGPEARDYAADGLLATLDDPWSPVKQLVESATALAEIGLEFHERCATVFRSVLGTAGDGMTFRDAARGLAALGPQYVNEAADALTTYARNRANRYHERAQAAETLRELGPLFGVAAGTLVRDMLAEPSTPTYKRDWCAYTLARLGSAYHAQAAVLLKAQLDSMNLRGESSTLVFDGLVELGSDYHTEIAQALRRAVEDPLTDGQIRISLLGRLAKLGQSHRSYASEQLRMHTFDRTLDVDTRTWAAYELVQLGPEYHSDVEEILREVLDHRSPENIQIPLTCSILSDLNMDNRALVAQVLTEVLNSPRSRRGALLNAASYLAAIGPDHRAMTGRILTTLLTDRTRPAQHRLAAADALVRLGGEYDRNAVDGLLNLLHQEDVDLGFQLDWTDACSLGVHARRELADALHTRISHPQADPRRIVNLATAIAKLSEEHVDVAVSALETVLANEAAEPWLRFDAAAALAELCPERTAEAVAAIQRCVHPANVVWILRTATSALAKLGYDATAMVVKVLDNGSSERKARQTAAELLLDFDPDASGQAITELRHQSGDTHLDDQTRGEILMSLAELRGAAPKDAFVFHQQLLDDEEQPIPIRCYAAMQVVRLDRAQWPDAVALLRRLLADPNSMPADCLAVVQRLAEMNAINADETQRLARALIWDPTLDSSERQEAIGMLRGQMRLDGQRIHLADHRVRITDRIPKTNSYYDPPPLAVETEGAIREILAAPEFGLYEKVDAAVALTELAFRAMPEAVEILTEIINIDSRARFHALWQMAWLDGPPRLTALSRNEAMVTAESLPARIRRLAAVNLMIIEYRANPVAVGYLRRVAANRELPGICRVDAMYALRHVDGPEPMRAVRDDPQLALAVRVEAAVKLVVFTADDRAVAAELLGRVGADQIVRPALRLRALATLVTLGGVGRRLAMDVLGRMVDDAALPATVRARAASQLGKVCPARRPRMIRALREIQGCVDPLRRVRVLGALGAFSPETATPELLAIAGNRALRPVTRLRAAEELAQLRLDYREAAAVVARELMRDGQVAWHVRRHAACVLARWSQVCRQEARDVIRGIDSD